MYSNCGSFDDAYCVFNLLDTRTAATWNAAISACARNNDYILSDKLFNDMVESGSQPEEITFICVLSACSRGGLVDKGCLYLRSMMMTFGMSPALEHMNSMVDILSQAKKWEEAEDLLETIPFACNTVGWMSLLSSCRTHTALDVGKRCFSYVVQMDPAQASGYVLMSNIYARSGLRENAEATDELRLSANGWKKPGKAFIEVDNFVHDFSVDDRHHSHRDEIREKLKVLSVQMKQEGYKPCMDLVLGPLSTEEKEDALNGHCEKLAMAFGLISTPPGTTIRIAKNLRVCIDCHSATKAVSKIERREIIIADTHCVHKFNNGMCSCCDAV
jgi:pentatricopeptide repeat protein